MTRRAARAVLAALTDPGSWQVWDSEPADLVVDNGYADELAQARARTGIDEAVITGCAAIRGHRVALVVGDFGFLGGSIGVAAGNRISAAIRRATAEKLPLVALPASGGTRMQEGTAAFLQMVTITQALIAHKTARLPYLVYLRDPTTGGVFASWGSLGHITAAEPGALLGFLGPRVYEALHGVPFPAGVQTAENLYRCGLVDAVVSLEDFGTLVGRTLTVLARKSVRLPAHSPLHAETADVPAWESVLASRRADRPGVREVLRYAARSTVALRAGGGGGYDPALLITLAQFGGTSCLVLGHDRQARAPLGPHGLRQARHGMRLAVDLQLPLVTIIDTAGAALSAHAEEAGLAGEIAGCIAALVSIEVPTVSLILGQGTGGAALALLPADRILAAQHGWLAPLPPEGASAIVHRDTSRAASMAASHGIRSADLLADGTVDAVIPETPDAAVEPIDFCRRIGVALHRELLHITWSDTDTRLNERAERFDRFDRACPAIVQTG